MPALNSKRHVVRDYLLFLILTGLRRGEAARLKWSDVDLKAKTFTIVDTKNREPHKLPLSDFLLKLLTERKEKKENPYVFPGPGPSGYLTDPERLKEKVAEQSAVSFTLHDLRRTFITIAESLDIPAYALKRLLNHKMANDADRR
jgi:integrase